MTTTSAPTRAARADLARRVRARAPKLTTADEAIAAVRDGDHVAIGGTLYSRTPMALVFALVRAGRRELTVSRPLTCYEGELLLVEGLATRVVTSWMGIGLPWGLSQVLRHYAEAGLADYEEWSHLAIGLGYKAAAMGVPFLPTYTMLGSDLARSRGLAALSCPYTGERLAAVPALCPDVVLLHAHRADVYGNVQIDGYLHMDVDMARAARTVIVSAEEIVDEAVIRADPAATSLPHFAVDAVVEAPFGAYPHECYGCYEADTEHFDAYVSAQRAGGLDAVHAYVDANIRRVGDFQGFLDRVGSERPARQARRATALVSR